MHWNNVPKFDYTLKKFDGYWDIADVDAFVDSELGNDSTGSGTATAPYKTISKVKSIGATKWAAGKVIMINGVFDESLTIDVAVRIVGAGGGEADWIDFDWTDPARRREIPALLAPIQY